MMPVDDVPWLDQDQPHEPDRSHAQINALLRRFATPASILELGCGGGRVLQPLIEAGHTVVGVDRDGAAIDRCRNAAGREIALIIADFTNSGWDSCEVAQRGPFDAILMLGNTFMTIWNVNAAVTLLNEIRRLLRSDGGVLILDDIPHDLWPLLTEGSWMTGLSAADPDDPDDDADTAAQLIWSPDDAVFTLRTGRFVDTERWTIGPNDTRYRLWTMAALALAARLAGLSAPAHDAEGGLLILERLQSESSGD